MTKVWTVIIIDRASTYPAERQQDLTAVFGVDMQGSVFNPTTSPKPSPSRLLLSFPMATPDLYIRELMEVWAGWRDDTTHVWSNTDSNGQPDPVFGGYITRIERETVLAGEKIIECSLSDYGILLTKTDVKGWPTFVTSAPTTNTGVGYPTGYSVQDWLIGSTGGGAPYNGVVRAHLQNIRYDGVEPMFATIVFNADTLPGTLDPVPGVGTIQGYYGGGDMTVGKVVQSLADAALFTYVKNYTGPDLVVGYWMSADIGSDDTRVVPRFHFANVADLVTGGDFTVAANANTVAGEIQMLHPHSHSRDASDVRTRVNIFGVGGDPTQPDPKPLVYSSYLNTAHHQIYPTYYQVETGWGGGAIFDSRLHTVATANFLSQYIENRAWGAKGSIEFTIQYPVVAGQRIRVRDPNEAIDQVYIVTSSERNNDGTWRVRVGFTQQTVSDIVKGGLADVLLIKEDLAFQTGALLSRSYPGQGKQVPVEMQPISPERNFITPSFSDVPGLSIQSSAFPRPTGYEPGPLLTPDPAYPLQIFPPKSVAVPHPAPGTWISQPDARPHPNSLHPGGFIADGTYPVTIAVYQTIITAIDIKGPGSVVLNKNGSAVTGTISGTGHHVITPVVYAPFVLPSTPPDDMSLTLTGTSSTTPTYVVVWEA